MGAAEHRELIRDSLRTVSARVVIVSDELVPACSKAMTQHELVGAQALTAPGPRLTPEPVSPQEAAFLQFSSGTTGHPRAVELSGSAIGAQLTALEDRLQIDPDSDRIASWLPLTHDMGLIGAVLVSRFAGLPLLLSSPERFVAKPSTWLGDCVEHQATLTATMPSGLVIGSRRWNGRGSLRSLRSVVVGGDRVHWDSLTSAQQLLAGAGLHRTALRPAYGMAENALAVTMTKPSESPSGLWVRREALADGCVEAVDVGADEADPIVALGEAVTGTTVSAPRDRIGPIEISGESVATRYIGDPQRSQATFPRRGAARTGDLGFQHAGQLYVIGRHDDVIVIDGNNFVASDIERVVEAVPGIRGGGAAAVLIGRRDLTVMLELSSPPDRDLRARVVAAARTAVGAPVAAVWSFPAGSLPRTASGKLQRRQCVALVLDPPPAAMLLQS